VKGGGREGVWWYLGCGCLFSIEEVMEEVAQVSDGHQQTVTEVSGDGSEQRNTRSLVVVTRSHGE